MNRASTTSAGLALAIIVFGAGCGGGMPLLHPARTLPRGDVRAATGLSAQFATGDLASALAGAREEAATRPTALATNGPDATYAKGALVAAAVAPGLAPFAAARVGVGASFEGGLGYTGRGIRLDVRRGFPLAEEIDLSVGVAGSAPLYGRDAGSLPDVDLSKLRGYGADIPILVGWESVAGLYRAWAGARAGIEHVSLENATSDPRPGQAALAMPLDADRIWGGFVIGAAVGFRTVHVALELDGAYQSVRGSFAGMKTDVAGFSLSPATALTWDF
ncbi:MAG: hypothetical protein U0235_03580 [Polyangiaceae bacterium]